MQAKTINRLVNEAIAEGKDPGQRVADLVKQEQDIKLKIRLRQNDIDVATEKYKKEINSLKIQIIDIQARCPHIEFTYYGDPSGGNDSHHSCNWCGKEW